ncbi:MAG: hypothetical protein ACOH14_06365 [Rhodoglobus sp.]
MKSRDERRSDFERREADRKSKLAAAKVAHNDKMSAVRARGAEQKQIRTETARVSAIAAATAENERLKRVEALRETRRDSPLPQWDNANINDQPSIFFLPSQLRELRAGYKRAKENRGDV